MQHGILTITLAFSFENNVRKKVFQALIIVWVQYKKIYLFFSLLDILLYYTIIISSLVPHLTHCYCLRFTILNHVSTRRSSVLGAFQQQTSNDVSKSLHLPRAVWPSCPTKGQHLPNWRRCGKITRHPIKVFYHLFNIWDQKTFLKSKKLFLVS